MIKAAKGKHRYIYPQGAFLTGDLQDVHDHGETPGSGRKATAILVNPSTAHANFDLRMPLLAFGVLAEQLIELRDGPPIRLALRGRLTTVEGSAIALVVEEMADTWAEAPVYHGGNKPRHVPAEPVVVTRSPPRRPA